MITKEEWLQWKDNKVTKILVDLIKAGSEEATRELQELRGEVGDFQRGAILAYDEIITSITRGEYLFKEE